MNGLADRFGVRLQTTAQYDLEAYPLSSPFEGRYLFFAYIRDEKIAHDEKFWESIKKSFPELLILSRAYKGQSKSEPLKTLFWDIKELPPEVWCKEGWIKFKLETGEVLNPGLFLDQKENRRILFEKIQETIQKKTFAPTDAVLNLFSFTGSFSITAVAAGLKRTTSVDVSARYLAWEKSVFEANFGGAEEQGVEHRLIKEDARVFLTRALKRGDRYRWIVIDPPTFSKGQGKPFKVSDELPQLVELAAGCLAPGGGILASSNDSRWPLQAFTEEMQHVATKKKLKLVPGKLPSDFSNAHPLKAVWLES